MTLDLIDTLIMEAELEEGRDLKYVVAGNRFAFRVAPEVKEKGKRSGTWSPEEDQFLEKNLGWIEEAEIARLLGRSQNAVHLRWERDLHLPAPSKNPDIITGHQAARLLGIYGHKIIHWCDEGLIPSRKLPGGRVIRVIPKVSFDRWVVSPSNWIYFDWKKIPDQRLRRLCKLRAQRWGDEWMSTAQAAKMRGVTPKDFTRLITKKKTVPGVQAATSLGGRHWDRAWANWFVLKSDAVKAEFLKGKGSGHEIKFTPRAERWMLRARKLGFSCEAIARSMGSKHVHETIRKNINRLLKEQKRRRRA